MEKNKEKILKGLILDLAPNFTEEQITFKTDLINELMLNSISVIQLIVSIEDTFNIEIDDQYLLLEKLNTLEKLMEIINHYENND